MAVYPPPSALAELAQTLDQLKLGATAATGANVGLQAPARWHVTLVFLGEVADEQAPAAAGALKAGVSRWRASAAQAPRLRLAGGGRFGRRRFTVLWVGLDGDLPGLAALARGLRRELRRARLPGDDRRPFRPHLTLARPGERLPAADLAADLATLADYEGQWWRADAVQLVCSRPGPTPEYESLATVPLIVPS